jgi:hypothetical protein
MLCRILLSYLLSLSLASLSGDPCFVHIGQGSAPAQMGALAAEEMQSRHVYLRVNREKNRNNEFTKNADRAIRYYRFC